MALCFQEHTLFVEATMDSARVSSKHISALTLWEARQRRTQVAGWWQEVVDKCLAALLYVRHVHDKNSENLQILPRTPVISKEGIFGGQNCSNVSHSLGYANVMSYPAAT